MLKKLIIRNLVIVQQIEIDLAAGMSALTGETGAGKSVLLSALELVLGKKADRRLIRNGCEQAEIEAYFDIKAPALIAWLQKQGLGSTIHIRRLLQKNGRNACWLNQKAVSVKFLQRLGQRLVHIHGQQDQQRLARQAEQLKLLDLYGDHADLLQQVQADYQQLVQARQALTHWQMKQKDSLAQLDYLQFQIEELKDWVLPPQQLQEWEQKQHFLAQAQRLKQDLARTIALIEHQDMTASLYRGQQWLQAAQDLQAVQIAMELLESARVQIEEALIQLNSALQSMEASPEELEQIEIRLNQIYQLARKHQVRPEELTDHLQKMEQDYQDLIQIDERIAEAEQALAQAEHAYQISAQQLSHRRHEAAKRLAAQISQSMQQLGMQGGRFTVKIEPRSPGHQGCDQVTFLIQTNPGHELAPLSQAASGGELSRISLAIQAATAHLNAIPTLVFDEVDSGTGGAIAEKIGQLLRQLSQYHQVLCITHLPQVAAQAEHHFLIKKYSQHKKTYNQIIRLNKQQRTHEIARMLAGSRISEPTLAHAAELLRFGDGK